MNLAQAFERDLTYQRWATQNPIKTLYGSRVAIKHNPDIKRQYERLVKNGKSKMSALGAAMRKLV